MTAAFLFALIWVSWQYTIQIYDQSSILCEMFIVIDEIKSVFSVQCVDCLAGFFLIYMHVP